MKNVNLMLKLTFIYSDDIAVNLMLYFAIVLNQGFEIYLQISYQRISRHRVVYHVFVFKITFTIKKNLTLQTQMDISSDPHY